MSEPGAAHDRTAAGSLVERIRGCRICRDTPMGSPLPHEPRPVLRISPHARIVVCGQAPGVRVHASGLPFDDPSGDRLRAWMGLDRATFYDPDLLAFVPMGFCFPGLDAKGGDLPPRRECAARWRHDVLAGLAAAELMLLIGQYAQRWHLGAEARGGVTTTLRRWRPIYEVAARPRRLVLPHPSWRNSGWLKRNPWFEAEVMPTLRATVAAIAGTRRQAATATGSD